MEKHFFSSNDVIERRKRQDTKWDVIVKYIYLVNTLPNLKWTRNKYS